MNFKSKVFFVIISLLANSLMFAQQTEPAAVPLPNKPAGGVGPGAQAVPIDNYIYFLIILAVFGIAYFANNYKKQVA